VAKAEPAKVDAASNDPFEKGKALYAEGKYKEAAPLWREVLRKQPGHAGAYFYAGLTRYQLGEMDKAEFNLKKGLEYKDEGNDANYFLALIAKNNKKQDQELKFLAAYMKKAAPSAKYRAAAEARIAEIKAEKDSKNQPAAAPATETVAKVETKAAEPAPAKAVEEAPVAEPKVADIADAPSGAPTIANANLLYSAGSIEAAVKMYKALLETELQPEERYFTMLQLGNAYRELRDFHSAVVRYREVVQQFPDSDWAAEAERALEDAVWLEKHASELPRRTR
jgi:tetratricopeptide (TPR) repeat protein